MKTCTRCLAQLPVSLFSKRQASADGLRSTCKPCDNAYANKHRQEAPEKVAAAYAKWASANPERVRELQKRTRNKRQAQRSQYNKEWRLKNPTYHDQYRQENADYWKEKNRRWQLENRGKSNFYTAMYRLAKSKATPVWLTNEDIATIEAMYRRAAQLTAETGIPHEVDHIIPLRGKTVSGLHVPANLQVIARSVNRRKSNSFT